jgi:hypothetical protein
MILGLEDHCSAIELGRRLLDASAERMLDRFYRIHTIAARIARFCRALHPM